MATRNLVPRGNNEGSLGIDGQRWSALHVASISTDTLKVTNIQLKANDNLPLFVKGPGIADISTNDSGQFVIQMDSSFLEDLGFNTTTGLNAGFTRNNGDALTNDDSIASGDSLKTAIQKLNDDVRGVAVPTTLTVANFAPAAILIAGEAFSDDDNHLMTAAAINDRIESFGYGDITSVTAEGGLSGGGNSGAVTLSIADQNNGDNGGFDAGTFGSASAIPQITVNQKGIITGITTQNVATSLTITGDNDANDTIDLLTDTLDIEGGTGISTTVSDNKVSIALTSDTVSFGGVSLALGSSDATPAFDLQDATNLPTTALTGTITNDQLAGNIANGKLVNSSVSFGGVSLSLGGEDATPAFDLQDATNLPTTALTGTITNDQLAGNIANGKLVNNSVSFGGVSLSLGGEDATPAFDLQDATNYPASSLTGSISLAQIDAAAIQTEAEVVGAGGIAGFGDNDTSLLTAAAIKQFVDAQGFGQGSGDISRVNITAGTGLSGSADTAAGEHTQTLSLANTAVTPAAYGSATQVATFTVDQQGRLTAASNSAITIASTSVSDFTEAVQDITNAQLVTNGSHAGISAVYDDAGDGAIDLTVSAGSDHIQNGAVTAAKFNADVISGQTELAAGLEATDELLVSDAGAIKKMDASVLQAYMQNNLTFTTNTDVDVSKANLLTRLASYDSNDTVNIGDGDNDTTVVIRGNLTVQGTTTTVNTVTMEAANAVLFEGATPDEFETTLTVIDPTQDRTIRLPNQDGYLPLLAAASTTQISSTPEELNLLDGSAADTVVNQKAVIYSDAGKIRGDLTGNADTATKIATAVNIGGVEFDGSASIDLPGVNTAGNQDTSGNAATATEATNITATANNNTAETVYLTFVDGATGTQGIETDTGLTYNPNTGLLTSTSFAGSLTGNVTGNADTATALATARSIGLGGNLGGSANFDGTAGITIDATIQQGVVANSMLANDGWSLKVDNANQEDINLGDILDFNGTASQINITYASQNNDLTFSLPETINVNTSGNAATATILQTTRSIALSGDVSGSANFNGSANASITTTIGAGTVHHTMLAEDIVSGQTELAHVDIADTDDLIIHDASETEVKKVGVDSLRDHFFGAVSGDVVVADGGVATIQTSAVEHGMLAENIVSGQTELAHADIRDADEIIISDTDNTNNGGSTEVKKVGVDSLRDHFFGAVSGDIAIADGGTASIGAQKVTNAMLADDAVGADELAANAVVNASIASDAAIDITKLDFVGANQLGGASLAQDDDFVVYDASTTANKRVTFSNLEDSIFANITAAGGDATIAAGGAITISAGAVEYSMIDPDAIKDEDDMASDSASHLATQQSIKKYVDDQLGRFGGIFKTGTVDNGKAASINRDVIFDSSPLVRSHFGPFAYDLGQLASSNPPGSDIIFFGVTATGASDRHFLVIGSGDFKGDTLFTGANADTP